MLPALSHMMLLSTLRRSAALSPPPDRRNATGLAKHCGTTAVKLAVMAAWTKPCPASCPGSSRRKSVCCPWRRRDWRGSCRRRSGGSGGRSGGPSRSASTSSASLACSPRPWSASERASKRLWRRQIRRLVYWWPPAPPAPHHLHPSRPREPSRPSLSLLRRCWGQHCVPAPSPARRWGQQRPRSQKWSPGADTCPSAATASGSSEASSRRASCSTHWTNTTRQTGLMWVCEGKFPVVGASSK